MTSAHALLGIGAIGVCAGVVVNVVLRHMFRTLGRVHFSWRRHLAVQLLTPILFVAATLRFGMTLELPAYLYLVCIAELLAMIDFEARRLPDAIILPSYVLSVLMLMPAGAAGGDWGPAQRALAGLAAFTAMFFSMALAYPHAVSFGDVKLAGLFGIYLGWLGWDTLLIGVLGSFAFVGFGGTALTAVRRGRVHAVPIAPCLISSAVLALFVSVPISTWYASTLGHA